MIWISACTEMNLVSRVEEKCDNNQGTCVKCNAFLLNHGFIARLTITGVYFGRLHDCILGNIKGEEGGGGVFP